MQKKLIALAVAGLMAAPAFAQSNITLYGSVDVGVMSRTGDNGGLGSVNGRTEVGSGLSSSNRLGFKGVEDLGNGLKALFEIEYGFAVDEDTGGSTPSSGVGFTQNRHSYVGLTGGFGTVVAGRLDGVRYGLFNTYDPFAGVGVGNFQQMTIQYDRADNAVAYISPNFGGFGLVLAYATNTQGAEGAGTATCSTTHGGNACDDRLKTIMLTYDNGPVSLRADYETTSTQGKDNARLYVATFGGSYDFGVVKVSGVYDIIKGDENSFIGALSNVTTTNAAVAGQQYDRRNWFIGVKVPLGNINLKALYGQTKNKEFNNADAKKIGLGADYALSKRTALYAEYGHIKNDDSATHQINPYEAGWAGGLGTSGYMLGMKHKF